jgi:hypothetical protein
MMVLNIRRRLMRTNWRRSRMVGVKYSAATDADELAAKPPLIKMNS